MDILEQINILCEQFKSKEINFEDFYSKLQSINCSQKEKDKALALYILTKN